MKTCRKCGAEKALSEFNKDERRPDGRGVYCRPCNKAIQAAHYEKHFGSTHPLKKLRTLSAQERFALRYTVNERGCWMWKGHPRGSNGYGSLRVGAVLMPAHRYSWELHRGPIPDGRLVLHECDIPLCVNPSHLFLGTHQDNSDDKLSKGRQARGATMIAATAATRARGSRIAHAKLTESQIEAIRQDGRPQRAIAADYGVSQCVIHNVKARKSWRHI